MRNLKRALSLALASVMVLSMMVVGAGAANYDDFSDKDEIVNTEAVSVLVELGVINGKDDGSYDPTGIVTRAEMAKMICVVLNGGKDPALGASSTHTYTDTVNHWAEAYIEYCTQLGIVAGKGDGTFDPNGTVTATEAAKMLLVALGYNAGFEGMVGANWAISTNVLANQNKLYGGLDIDVDAGLTRDNAAQMAYNALNCEMVKYDYALVTGPNGSLTSVPRVDKLDDTLLSDKFGGVRVEGVVVANEFANLDGTKAMDEGETRIVVTNHDDGQSTYTDGAKTFNVSSGKDVLGRSVTIFVKPSTTAASTSTKGTVIGSVITNSDNTVVVDSGRDSLADLADDNKLELDYTTGEGDIFATQYVTNYGATEGNLTEAKTEEDGVRGEVRTIIDNNDDGVVDYVLTERFLLGKVTSYSTKDDGSITLNGTNSLSYDDAADVVGFDDVAKGDYVLYAEIGGKLYVEVAESVTGELTAYKNSGATSTLTVDDTKYNVSGLSFYSDSSKLSDPKTYNTLDKEAIFYLDAEGNVIAVDGTASSNSYAFLIAAAEVGGVDKSIEVKVALDDGTTKNYTLDKDNSDVDKDDEKLLCTYTINDDDEIALTKVAGVSAEQDNQAIKISKGKATVTGIDDAYADGSTVFFFVTPDGDYTADTTDSIASTLAVDEVKVYVGKDDVASLDTTTDFLYYVDDGDIKAVVVVTDSVGSSSNYIYLYQYVDRASNGFRYNAIVDGEIVKNVTVTTNEELGLYPYSTTSKGYYKVGTAIDNDAFITRIDGNSVIVGDTEYTLTDKTVIATIDGSSTALEAGTNEGDRVTIKFNTDKELEAVFVTETYSDSNTSILVPGTLTDGDDTDYAYTGATSDTDEASDLLAGVVVSYNATATLYSDEDCETEVESAMTTGTYYIQVVAKDGTSAVYSVAVTIS